MTAVHAVDCVSHLSRSLSETRGFCASRLEQIQAGVLLMPVKATHRSEIITLSDGLVFEVTDFDPVLLGQTG
jgi:hypothetical protein